jgi:ABC-type antimicrobial peptide transport system permease subunit
MAVGAQPSDILRQFLVEALVLCLTGGALGIAAGRGARGSLRVASVLRNRYTIQVDGKPLWTFRTPLFTVRFWGGTDEAAEFWVVLSPSKMDWSLLVKPGVEHQPLLASLSFIHSEWWNYS